MPDPDGLTAIAVAFFVVTVSPGPANVAVAVVALREGLRSGLRFGLGLSVGLAFWGGVAATGMGALLRDASPWLVGLKLFGGFYLLWLAFRSAQSALRAQAALDPVEPNARWFRRGLLLNLSNPKAVVAWMAALSVGLGGHDDSARIATATLVCMILGALNYTGHALVFSRPGAMAVYGRARRWVEGVVAGLFAVAGLGLIRSALTR